MKKIPWFWFWMVLVGLATLNSLLEHHWIESYLWIVVAFQTYAIRVLEHAHDHRAGTPPRRRPGDSWTCSTNGCAWVETR
jgi:hypothetical protein